MKKKYVNRFFESPLEELYYKRFGELPDTTFFKLLHGGFTPEDAGRIRDKNMEIVYKEQLAAQEEELRRECPFLW